VVLAASSVLLAKPLMAADYSMSGESDTYLRMRTTIDKKDFYPLYEYLRFSVAMTEKDGSAVSLHMGAWGRADLKDKSTQDNPDGDLQYGYLSYHGAKNNLLVNAGRQFVTEGVATERIDGVYARSDFAAGFKAAVFAGAPVVTEPNFAGGDFVYGGRLSQGKQGLYSVGLSALRNEGENSSRDREEEGVDLWIQPLKQVDLTGRSSYNSITEGWMEHAYTLSVTPLAPLRFSANLSKINYRDYFYNVTTTALSLTNGLIDPNEELLTVGAAVAYDPIKNLTVSVDYKKYMYEMDGEADYVGGKLSYALPDSLAVGVAAHRMSGDTDRLRYSEFRLYALKKLGPVELSADFFDVNYDRRINGVRDSIEVSGSGGYRFNEKLKVSADLQYSHNPDFDNEVRGLVKVAYAFDTKRGEGRGKSEK
jgi:hypothetical protein